MTNRSDRTINTSGGNYIGRIGGNYIERVDGDVVEGKSSKASSPETNTQSNQSQGKNFVENLGGQKVNRWF